jgi:hypothetical protein
VLPRYADDEENSDLSTRLRMLVGGGSPGRGVGTGIHWHMNLANEVEYVTTDDKRETIPYVRLTEASGRVVEYWAPGATAAALDGGERRRMDCMDCHNRPSHTFAAGAGQAVDAAIAANRISRDLPFVRREAVRVLGEPYSDRETALAQIERDLHAFFRGHPPDRVDDAAMRQAIVSIQDLYRQNVFPAMHVGWGTYVNQLGHTDTPGCFRCHDDEHRSAEGRVISQDCASCHTFE